MLPADAAKILDLPLDSRPEQLEARFLELRTRLEDKIAKAPTPGLKAKYRESLEEITFAFETLTLAADSSALPVLQKQGAASQEPGAVRPAATSTRQPAPVESASSRPAPKKKTGSKEFAIVAMVAVVLLGVGGWFVMKSRAENAEKARIAAEQKAEAERIAEGLRREEEERQRLLTQLRVEFAALNVRLESLLDQQSAASRELSDLKSQEREALRDARGDQGASVRLLSARVQAMERYARQVRELLSEHPARTQKVQIEQLLQAKDSTAAQAQMRVYAASVDNLKSELTMRRDETVIFGGLQIDSNVPTARWSLTDALGATRTGVVPATISEVPLGKATVVFTREGWLDVRQEIVVERNRTVTVTGKFIPGAVRLESTPSGAEIYQEGNLVGKTPLLLSDTPTGTSTFELRLHGHWPQTASARIEAQEETSISIPLEKFREFVIPALGLEMRPIPAGTFTMGSARGPEAEMPATRVTLTRPFWISATEVTQAQWGIVMGGGNPSQFRGGNLPVTNISWHKALEFCRKLTELEQAAGRLPKGVVYRLPTEAEWEYSCRAGSTGDYAGDVQAMAWTSENSAMRTHPPGQKRANSWGLFDMHGNVWEWCLDRYGGYVGGDQLDPVGETSPNVYTRVIRGGAWNISSAGCRSSSRSAYNQEVGRDEIGFRVALVFK